MFWPFRPGSKQTWAPHERQNFQFFAIFQIFMENFRSCGSNSQIGHVYLCALQHRHSTGKMRGGEGSNSVACKPRINPETCTAGPPTFIRAIIRITRIGLASSFLTPLSSPKFPLEGRKALFESWHPIARERLGFHP